MLSWLRRFAKARDGLAAIEFALIAPVLATFFLGSIEVTDALACKQKVTGMASTAADLIAQEKQVATGDIDNIYSAVNSIVYPYSATGLQITITSLVDNGGGTGKVAWSDSQNATPRTVGSTVAVPTGVITASGSVILVEVKYPYTSSISDFVTGTMYMTSTFYARPRRSTTIARV